ncbi:unnamed protein product [Rhizoctonia solani]|uniref:Uncharacterized protein n=1 Tax=Rhizoctonia solani TaxID=456999 RepID=A0A8H3DKE9_9AGAM|nr:unnamed protein product [Rhizoctonia solani]
MKERVLAAIEAPALSIEAWFESISEADGKNRFIDAAHGLLCIAPGIEEMSEEDMSLALVDQSRATSVGHAAQKERRPKDLHYYYKETRAKKGALNKRSRVALLQHIVLSIHTLKSALAWRRLENGYGENGKMTIVMEAYSEEEGCDVNFGSQAFKSFHKSIKDYDTGCARFLDAYLQLGSNLLLCQRLRLQRFSNPVLGPKLAEAVGWVVLPEAEANRRERIHKQALDLVISILGGSEHSELIEALADINTETDAM